MTALSSLYSSVRLFAQQCPDATIDKYVIEAVRDFCRRSWYYQETITVNIVNGTASYTITPTSSQELVAIASVKVEGDPRNAVSLDEIDSVPDDFSFTAYRFEPVGTLTLYPTPTANATGGLVVRAVIMPQESTTTIPDVIYRHYKEAITAGALSYILTMQNESWTNPQLAAQKYAEFMEGVHDAKGRRVRGFVRNLMIKPRPFAI